jgi:subtilisin family serine protease
MVELGGLMARTRGHRAVRIGLIDGPVAFDHPDLREASLDRLAGRPTDRQAPGVAATNVVAVAHGTAVAGILVARRGSVAPAICPACTLLIRPIFGNDPRSGASPSASTSELASAIHDCLDAGARVLNLSAAIQRPSASGDRELGAALDRAARAGALVVAAAGNQGALGTTPITRHGWVLPVIAYDRRRRPAAYSNLGRSIGSRGLGGPGDGVQSLGTAGAAVDVRGTSAAAAFVTGTAALLWSEFPRIPATVIKAALLHRPNQSRLRLVPPLLSAADAYRTLRN